MLRLLLDTNAIMFPLGRRNTELHVPGAAYRHSLWIQVGHLVAW